MRRIYAAIDIGATNVRVATGNESGISDRLLEATDKARGAWGVTSQIIRMLKTLDLRGLHSIGVGSIGPLRMSEGCIVGAPNLPFKEIPIVKPLEEEFKVPVRLINDCSAAALGEHIYGAGRGVNHLVYVTLSTGIGGGAIVDGHLLQGKDGNAHEVGHLTIDPYSELTCGCGCRGHWEAYCGGINIPNYARLLLRGRKIERGPLLELAEGNLQRLTAETIFRAAGLGDPTALWVVEKIGEVNAVGFANIVNVYDPELITVGGSIALKNQELILRPIEQGITNHLINRKPKIIITPLGEDAVLYGALALAWKCGDQL
ncbi:MAG: ROK family protein [Candidatus Bathyarchaeia archaeon]|nr:ROK family protein [Candidatus Bathyarchaeota archaeon]